MSSNHDKQQSSATQFFYTSEHQSNSHQTHRYNFEGQEISAWVPKKQLRNSIIKEKVDEQKEETNDTQKVAHSNDGQQPLPIIHKNFSFGLPQHKRFITLQDIVGEETSANKAVQECSPPPGTLANSNARLSDNTREMLKHINLEFQGISAADKKREHKTLSPWSQHNLKQKEDKVKNTAQNFKPYKNNGLNVNEILENLDKRKKSTKAVQLTSQHQSIMEVASVSLASLKSYLLEQKQLQLESKEIVQKNQIDKDIQIESQQEDIVTPIKKEREQLNLPQINPLKQNNYHRIDISKIINLQQQSQKIIKAKPQIKKQGFKPAKDLISAKKIELKEREKQKVQVNQKQLNQKDEENKEKVLTIDTKQNEQDEMQQHISILEEMIGLVQIEDYTDMQSELQIDTSTQRANLETFQNTLAQCQPREVDFTPWRNHDTYINQGTQSNNSERAIKLVKIPVNKQRNSHIRHRSQMEVRNEDMNLPQIKLTVSQKRSLERHQQKLQKNLLLKNISQQNLKNQQSQKNLETQIQKVEINQFPQDYLLNHPRMKFEREIQELKQKPFKKHLYNPENVKIDEQKIVEYIHEKEQKDGFKQRQNEVNTLVRDHLNIKLSTEVRNIRFTKPIVMENVFDGKKVDMEKLKKKLKNFQKRSTSVQPKVNEEYRSLKYDDSSMIDISSVFREPQIVNDLAYQSSLSTLIEQSKPQYLHIPPELMIFNQNGQLQQILETNKVQNENYHDEDLNDLRGFKMSQFEEQWSGLSEMKFECQKLVNNLKQPRQLDGARSKKFLQKFEQFSKDKLNQLKSQKLNNDQIVKDIGVDFGSQLFQSEKYDQERKQIKEQNLLEQYLKKIDPLGDYNIEDNFQSAKKAHLKMIKKQMSINFKFQEEISPNRKKSIQRKQSIIDTTKFFEKAKMARLMKENNSATIQDLFEKDPKFQFIQNLLKNRELPQTFLDGIVNKTLIISEFSLTKGILDSLLKACQNFGDIISRIVFDNNNLSDQNFGKILEALSELKQFKSITYRQNEFGTFSNRHLNRILAKKIPNHLEELIIENCQMHQSAMEELVYSLEQKCILKKLALVKININDQSFYDLSKVVQKVNTLEEIDLSYNTLRPQVFLSMLKAIMKNKNINIINLAWNKLACDNDEYSLPVQKSHDKKVLKYLTFIIKDHPKLLHLNLTKCGLSERIIFKLVKAIKMSRTIQSVHFCGNPGLTQKLRQSLAVKYYEEKVKVEKKKLEYKDAMILKNVKKKLQLTKNKQDNVLELEKSQKMVLQRMLGEAKVIGVEIQQWIASEKHCWICDCWILVVVLAQEQDEAPTIKCEYKNEKMINLKEFCKQIDQNVPNFLQELVDNGKLKNITDELTKYQQNQLNKKIKAYEDAYSTTYLDVLQKNLGYQKPVILNPQNNGYISIMMVKPGKFAYFIDDKHYQEVIDIREEQPFQIDSSVVQENKKEEVFSRPNSIFADFRVDNVSIIRQCFKNDEKFWKIPRLSKSHKDLTQVYSILQDNYQFLKDLFVTLAAASKYPFITMFDFTKFIFQSNLSNENLRQNQIERIFIATIQPSTYLQEVAKDISKKLNPDNLMTRNEFVEGLVRCASSKYLYPSNIPQDQKNLSSAVNKFITELKEKSYVYPFQEFRDNHLWQISPNKLFKHHEKSLREVFDLLILNNTIQEKYLTLQNMIKLFVTDSSIHLREKDLIQLYGYSKMTNPEEFNESSAYKYNRLRFVEFLELIARIGDFIYQETDYDYEKVELTHKINVVVLEILYVTGVEQKLESDKERDSSGEDQDFEY